MDGEGGEGMTVYADILFFVNFSMDLLTLILTGKILGRRPQKRRLLFAAAEGGALGTLLIFLPSGRVWRILSVVFGIVTAGGMTWTAFGYGGFLRLFRESFILWGVGSLFGGITTFIMTLGEPIYLDFGNHYPTLFLLCSGCAVVFSRLFTVSRTKRSAVVDVTVEEKTYSITVLCDSGSFAKDPISARPAILVRRSIMEDVYERLARGDVGLKVRIIPVGGIDGKRILYGLIPDRVEVEGRTVDAVVAFLEAEERPAGFDGILPAALCHENILFSRT